MGFPTVTLRLPDWVEELIPDQTRSYPTDEDRMGLVVELSRLNVERGTGDRSGRPSSSETGAGSSPPA
jgi:hypothetical protein